MWRLDRKATDEESRPAGQMPGGCEAAQANGQVALRESKSLTPATANTALSVALNHR